MVLVIDDQVINIEILSGLLKLEKLTTDKAHCGMEAIKQV